MTNNILPIEYTPQTVDEFVGPARAVARQIANIAAKCKPRGVSTAVLFYGPPGTGKSALAAFTMKLFEVPKWNLTMKNGVDLSVDAMREIADDIRFTSMFAGYRGLQFDECDMSKRDGQARFLTIADQLTVVKQVVIAATCNSHIEELEERFQRRFQVFSVTGPTVEELTPLAAQWVSDTEAKQLCEMAARDEINPRITRPVNVGAFFKDLTTYVCNK